jgi:hypothetical protein
MCSFGEHNSRSGRVVQEDQGMGGTGTKGGCGGKEGKALRNAIDTNHNIQKSSSFHMMPPSEQKKKKNKATSAFYFCMSPTT